MKFEWLLFSLICCTSQKKIIINHLVYPLPDFCVLSTKYICVGFVLCCKHGIYIDLSKCCHCTPNGKISEAQFLESQGIFCTLEEQEAPADGSCCNLRHLCTAGEFCDAATAGRRPSSPLPFQRCLTSKYFCACYIEVGEEARK